MRRSQRGICSLMVMLGPGGLLSAPPAAAADVAVSADVTTSTTWTSDNTYILTQPIFVTNGATLTIEPGTVVRGEPASGVGTNDPGTLIIARGSKIRAVGTPEAPIVFTDLLDDNLGGNPGTFPYDALDNALGVTGQWGGVILLGRAYVANNTLGGPDANREVAIEGLNTSPSGFYGNGGDDDDDSGSLAYVSIRYGGFNLSANNEINGLTLGAVGRETDVDHVEVFQNKDDGVEMFGGTVNVKHLVAVNAGDDGIDYDEGYRGKGQFLFVMQGTPGSDKSDKGGEHDGGNAPDGSQPRAIPTFYNATYVGLGNNKAYTNRLQNTTLHFRDNAGGRYYNSFFADFGGAPLCIEGGNTGGSSTAANSSGERSITPYVVDGAFYRTPPSAFELELEDNTWYCTGNGGVVPVGDATAVGCDAGKVHHDNGVLGNAALDNQYLACGTALPIRELARTDNGNPTLPDPITAIDPRPAPGSPLLTTNRVPPEDGFFEPAPYRGAFAPGNNWMGGWTAMSRLGYIASCAAGSASAIPSEPSGLAFGGPSGDDPMRLDWDAPPAADDTEVYDTLRSSSPDFTGATCLETDDGVDRTAFDAELPGAGQVFFYLVRAGNACGEGGLGTESDGTPRLGASCP